MIKLALSGMQIFKLLPRTNCKDCGSPSCLAFAMKVAAGKADLDRCPHISAESRNKLEDMMAPPIIEIELTKKGEKKIIGGEKVIYRHDESFYHPTAIAVECPEGLTPGRADEFVKSVEALSFERVGETISVDAISLTEESCSDVIPLFEKIRNLSDLPIIIRTLNPDTIDRIDEKGVIVNTSLETAREKVSVFKEKALIPAVDASDREEAENVGSFFKDSGIKSGIISISADSSAEVLDLLHTLRSEALIKGNRKLGYPSMVRSVGKHGLCDASTAIMKYGSIVVISNREPDKVLPLLTLRQNVFTDPRRPIQVEAKLYEFGEVSPESPALITTNFSLTYFSVAQEIEASGIPSRLLIIDTEGTSVLTAWSADRFNRKIILDALNSSGLSDLMNKKEIIIPGYVAVLKEEIEEDSDWKVIAGPREASGIPGFLRKLKQKENSLAL